MFSKITPTTVAAQGWKAGKTTVVNTAFAIPTATFNNTAAATLNLRLTKTAALSADANVFDGIAAGDLLSIPLTLANSVTVVGTLDLEVAQVVPDGAAAGTAKGYIVFKQLVSGATGVLGTGLAITITGATATVSKVMSVDTTATVAVQSKTVDTVTISAHGIPIYNGFISKFYNAYIPYHYGGPNVAVSKDIGALLIPFNLYPGYMTYHFLASYVEKLDKYAKPIKVMTKIIASQLYCNLC
jgi:hypothetical protein